MRRIFIALKIPEYIQKKIISHRIKAYPDYQIFKWEPINKLHITLKFIGDFFERVALLNFIFHSRNRKNGESLPNPYEVATLDIVRPDNRVDGYLEHLRDFRQTVSLPHDINAYLTLVIFLVFNIGKRSHRPGIRQKSALVDNRNVPSSFAGFIVGIVYSLQNGGRL